MLHHTTVGTVGARRHLYVLHGLYGTGRHWTTFARRLVRSRPDWRVVLVDLRLHGSSHGFRPPHTVRACADDVAQLVAARQTPMDAVLGHSFGGKVALMLAGAGISTAPRQTWVIDSSPSRRKPEGAALGMLQAITDNPGPFTTRADGRNRIEEAGFAPGVAAWMATNLVRDGGGYRWRFIADNIADLLGSYFRVDLWRVLERPAWGTAIHMVRALQSKMLLREDVQRIRALDRERIFLHELEGGHWVHVDNLDGLHSLVTRHLPPAVAPTTG